MNNNRAMIRFKAIESELDPLFPFSWELYISAFPEKERRGLDYHTESMSKERYHCEVVLDREEAIGILFWWDLSDYIYVEHFATTEAVRGRGYGKEILSEFIAKCDKPILLEVERPEDSLSRRRIGFYKRMGFILNEHAYQQPSYQQIAGEFVELKVMTYPAPITECELRGFIEKALPIIHFRN